MKEFYGKDSTEARVTAKSMSHSYDTSCRNYYKTNFNSFIDGIHFINKATGQMPEGSIVIDPKSKAANLIPKTESEFADPEKAVKLNQMSMINIKKMVQEIDNNEKLEAVKWGPGADDHLTDEQRAGTFISIFNWNTCN